MNDKQENSNSFTPRENFLMFVLNKVMKEYKSLLEYTRRRKPLKIVEIVTLSTIPGETKFAIQLTNKNCVLTLAADEIISHGYNLNEFNEFHADMIRHAAKGKLLEFLKLSEKNSAYKITSKKFDADMQQYIFTIETKDQISFTRTADEISNDKNILFNMNISDIHEIGYTQGSESILREKTAILLAKHK